jgi:hypothetical protein
MITTTVIVSFIAALKGPPGQQGPCAADQRDERQRNAARFAAPDPGLRVLRFLHQLDDLR